MSSNSTTRCLRHSAGRIGLTFATLLVSGSLLRAQDAIRPSLAGEASAEARRQSIEQIPYNLLVGPVRLRVSATAGIEYNDNVNISENDPQSDFIFRPQVNLDMLWPVTQLNTLRFDIGLGYNIYFDHSQYDTNALLLSPGSQLSFDVFLGDFRINFHDRFSLQDDPVTAAPTVSNVADYGRFENTGGVSVLWDLNKAVLTLGYDHYNYLSTTNDFDYLDHQSEELTGSLSFAVSSTTGVGLEGSYVFTSYDDNVLSDNDSYSGGAFIETQVTNYMKLRVAGGYQGMEFDRNFVLFGPFANGQFIAFPDQKDLNDYYANVEISHRINSAITQRLAAGHESQLGVDSNYIRLNYVRHTATWNIIAKTLLTTELFYEDAQESGGILDEHAHRYGGALALGYQLTRHVTLGARYQYTRKDSDVPLRDYTQNRVSLDGTYSF